MINLINHSYKIVILLLVYFISISQIHAFQNKIIFKVNNEIVTSIDILNEIEYRKLLNRKLAELPSIKQFEIAKKSLIREKIKKIETSNFFIDASITDEQLELIIKDFIKKTQLQSKDQLIEILDLKGMKIETILDKIKTEILWNQLILNKFSKNLKIDKIKIKNNILKNNIQKKYLLSEIVFNLEKLTFDEKYNLIKKEIYENGFENAASNYSISDSAREGGKLGWVKFNSLSENIKKEILTISINEFTKPIVIPGGFLILKINNEKNINIVEDIDLEVENISRAIANKQLNQFSTIYLNKIKKEFRIVEL